MYKIIKLFIFGLFCCINMHAIDVKSLIFGAACFSKTTESSCLRGDLKQFLEEKSQRMDEYEKTDIFYCIELMKSNKHLITKADAQYFISCENLLNSHELVKLGSNCND